MLSVKKEPAVEKHMAILCNMVIVIIFYVGLIMKNVVERIIWLMLMNQPFNHFNQTRCDYNHENDQNIWNHD